MNLQKVSAQSLKNRRVPLLYGSRLLIEPTYNPNKLIDALLDMLDFHTDAELARTLGITPSYICNIRRGMIPVGAGVLVRMHDLSGLSARELCDLMMDE